MIESGTLSEKGGAQKMMRRGILLLLSLGLVLVCSGCSNRQEDTGGTGGFGTERFFGRWTAGGFFTTDGDFMSQIVTESGYGPEDFFIYAMSGTDDFAYSAFARQIEAMLETSDGNFVEEDNEKEGNLAFRVQEGGTHNGEYAEQYIYNGLCWFWN